MKNIFKNVTGLLSSKENDDRYSTPATRQYFFRYVREFPSLHPMRMSREFPPT